MKELYNALPLPNDSPVTALAVTDDINKCPSGYTIVAKTYDQDLDADLWKDGFFGKRVTRYLCLSKTEGPGGFVVDSLCIVGEKDTPPNGYIMLSKTYGTEQKAWRKRQLCYRLSERSSVFLAITDIIILSKTKKAPEGFTMAGEVNGLVVCYKSAPIQPETDPKPLPSLVLPPLQVNLRPITPSQDPPSRNSSGYSPTKQPVSPSGPAPVRPAPLPPNTRSSTDNSTNRLIVVSSGTLSGHLGLEGVPFTLGPRIQSLNGSTSTNGLRGRYKTAQEINSEYQYSFATERGAMFRL